TVKGRDSILGFAAAEEFGTVNVQSGQIGPRSQPFVFVLDLHGLTGLRGQRFGFSGARLNAGLFIRRDDELVGAQFTALPEALVQIQNASGLGRKLWVSRKDPAAVLPRADGILVQPSPDGGVTEGGGQTTARTWEPSSVTLQRERGTPKRLGNSQAMALTCTTSSGGENPGSAGALAVFQTGQPFFEESFSPAADDLAPSAEAIGDLIVGEALLGQEHHLGAGYRTIW